MKFMDCPRVRAWTAGLIWPGQQARAISIVIQTEGTMKFMDCPRVRAWTARVDVAAGKGYINPAVQDLAQGQSINLHSARS